MPIWSRIAQPALGTRPASSLPGATQMSSGTASAHDGAVPPSIFYSFPSTRGTPATPSGRWAHSMVAVGRTLLVYGGIGPTLHDDLWLLDTDTLMWRLLSPRAASSKDKPDKMMGHAAVTIGTRMWIFGGQEGRSLLRKLYLLDLEAMTWTRLTANSDALPCARAGHAMVPVGGAVYLFGGQGKKLLNDLYRMDPETGTFTEIKAAGRLPVPRRGMSLVHDGKDSLVCFGGSHAGGIDASLSVFSLSRGEWSSPQQQGTVPTPRTNHTAVLLAPHQVLVFGGCNAQGTFHSDAYILDTRTFTWHKPHLLNAAPAARYYHTCCMVNGRAYLYGGISSKQTYDGVVVLDTRFDNDISHIAEELRALTMSAVGVGGNSVHGSGGSGPASEAQFGSAGSVHGSGAAAAAAAAGSVHGGSMAAASTAAAPLNTSKSLDIMKVQLMDLLYKRNMEELHAQASHKAEATEQLLAREREAAEVLRRENLQLKILAAEAEEAAAEAAERARQLQAQAAKGAASLAELRANLDARDRALAERESEVEAAKRLHQGLVKELGVVASRYAKLQQQHSKRKAAANRSTRSEQEPSTSGAASTSQRPTGSTRHSYMSSFTSQVTHAGGGIHAGYSEPLFSRQTLSRLSAQMQAGEDREEDGGGNSGSSSDAASSPPTAYDDTSGVFQLQPTVLSSMHNLQTVSINSAGSTASEYPMLAPFDDILSLLCELGQQKDELQRQVGALREQLDGAAAEAAARRDELARLSAAPEALRRLTLEELRAAEEKLEGALRATREAVMQRRCAEVERAASEQQSCSLCLERPRGVVFNCGHQACEPCSEKLPACPFCRTAITTRIKIFNT